PPLSTTQTISITVNEVNNAPVISSINSFTINEGTTMTFTNRATDSDTPKQNITWALGGGAPAGAAINSTNGIFTWTPTEAQGPGTYSITVTATDDGTPPQTGSRSFSVTVNEVNTPPTIAFQTDWTVQAQTPISFKATATDADLPAQGLVFTLDAGAPAGAAIDPATGSFSWTPTAANAGTNLMTLRVSDNGSPAGSDSKVLRVVVQSPLTASINVAGEVINISCNSISGRTYRVEYKGDLSTGSWTPLSTNTANASILNFQDTKGTNSQRFYRVMQVD
ncbi:MAG: wapA 2, partial [Verrucomicrobiales bacterium]|nr:wapA 2 [Verrucomicrobiales bacterium]